MVFQLPVNATHRSLAHRLGALTRLLCATVLLAFLQTGNANQQIINASAISSDSEPGLAIIDLTYASKPAKTGTTGLGVQLFFDSRAASIELTDPNPALGGLFLSPALSADIANEDGDAKTDQKLTFAWIEPTPRDVSKGNLGWPNFESEQDSVRLATLVIRSKNDATQVGSDFNFLLDTASGFVGLTQNFSVDFSTRPVSTTLGSDLSVSELSNAALAGTGGAADSDSDGMDDAYEALHGFDPYAGSDADDDADEDGKTNLDEYLQGSDPNVDDVPPNVFPPADITVDARGRSTAIDLGSASAVDAKDGALTPSPSRQGPFGPGRHPIKWYATDAAGNQGTGTQWITINPLVSVSPRGRLSEGQSLRVEAVLNGPAPEYPILIPISLAGPAKLGEDFDISSSTIEINEGTRGFVDINARSDELSEGSEMIELTLLQPASHAVLSESNKTFLQIVDGPVPPGLGLKVTQGTSTGRKVAVAGGPVTVQLAIQDPNGAHTVSWGASSASILEASQINGQSLRFDPANLPPGRYPLTALVSDSEIAGEQFKVQSTLFVQQGDVAPDQDGDGVPDAFELTSDSNAIPLDARLSTLVASTDVGATIRVGDVALSQSTPGIAVDEAAIAAYTGVTDTDYDYPSGLLDFDIEGLPIPGEPVRFVTPLGAAIPEDAVFRKYTDAGGWQNFQVDARNQIASAMSDDGTCPDVGDVAYTSGLEAGARCLQLTLEDGGPNDADLAINSVYSDPSGVAQQVASAGSTGSASTSAAGNQAGTSSSTPQPSGAAEAKSAGGGCSASNGSFDLGLILLLVMSGLHLLRIGRKSQQARWASRL
jgi:hypothetical protein